MKTWSLRAAAYLLVMRRIAPTSTRPKTRIKEHVISTPLLFVGVPSRAVRFASSDTGAGASVGAAIDSRILPSVADVTASGGIAGGALVFAGGSDAAGIEAAISSCAIWGTDLSVAAPIAGGSLGADALGTALVSAVLLSSGAAAEIDDGAVSCIVALLAGATFGVGSLGSALALAGMAAA